MRTLLLLVLVWQSVAMAQDNTQRGALANGRLPGTAAESRELINNLRNIEAYYEAVNKQLDKRFEREKSRDPFAKSEQIRKADEARQQADAPQFMPSDLSDVDPLALINDNSLGEADSADSGFPRMQYRGFVQVATQRLGLLDVNGIGTFVVRPGDKVGLQQFSREAVINIVEINKLNLIVEVGNFGEKIVVQ